MLTTPWKSEARAIWSDQCMISRVQAKRRDAAAESGCSVSQINSEVEERLCQSVREADLTISSMAREQEDLRRYRDFSPVQRQSYSRFFAKLLMSTTVAPPKQTFDE